MMMIMMFDLRDDDANDDADDDEYEDDDDDDDDDDLDGHDAILQVSICFPSAAAEQEVDSLDRMIIYICYDF